MLEQFSMNFPALRKSEKFTQDSPLWFSDSTSERANCELYDGEFLLFSRMPCAFLLIFFPLFNLVFFPSQSLMSLNFRLSPRKCESSLNSFFLHSKKSQFETSNGLRIAESANKWRLMLGDRIDLFDGNVVDFNLRKRRGCKIESWHVDDSLNSRYN